MSILTTAIEMVNDYHLGTNELNIDEMHVDVLAAFEENAKIEMEVNELFYSHEKLTQSLKECESLINVVETVGWSKGLVMFVDPDGKLANQGVVPSVESLEDGVSVEASTEGLKETLKKIWDFIVKTVQQICRFVSNIFMNVIKTFTKSSKMLEKVYEKYLKNKDPKDFDEEKWKKVDIKTIKVVADTDSGKDLAFLEGDLKNISVMLTTLITMIESADKLYGGDDKDAKAKQEFIKSMSDGLKKAVQPFDSVFTFEIDEKTFKFKYKRDEKMFKTEKINIGKHPIKNVLNGIEAAVTSKALVKAERAIKEFDQTLKVYDKTIQKVSKIYSKDDERSKEVTQFIRRVSDSASELVRLAKDVISIFREMTKVLVSSAVSLAKCRKVGKEKEEK